MHETLTTEQQALVSDNIKLVYYTVNKLPDSELKARYKDDLTSEGMLGLIKAAMSFDPAKSKFATYATRCILNEIFMFIRKLNKGGPTVSLSTVVGQSDDGREVTIGDMIADNNSSTDEFDREEDARIKQQLLSEFLSKRKPRDREVFELMKKGLKQREVANELGLSQSYISRIFKRLKKDFGKFKKRREEDAA